MGQIGQKSLEQSENFILRKYENKKNLNKEYRMKINYDSDM